MKSRLLVAARLYFWPHSRQRPEGPSVFGPNQSTVVLLPCGPSGSQYLQ